MFPKPTKPHKPLDTSGLPFPKPRRVKNKATIERTRKRSCELCGSIKGLQIHHVFTKGSGAGDTQENLVCLCVGCHTQVHNGEIARDDLLDIVAERERKTVEEIRRIVGKSMGRDYA